MQPPSIIWFSRLFMLSMALSIVDVVMNWTEMMASFGQDGQIGGSDFTMIVAIISLVFGFGVPLLLWFLVVWRASRAAKWILTVFAALGLLFLATPFLVVDGFVMAEMWISIVTNLINVAACVMLFRQDAVAWFRNDMIDPDTFS